MTFFSPFQGQSESKKGNGKIKAPTKGESISFGFRKKANTGAIKKYSTVDEKAANNNEIDDDNGNAGKQLNIFIWVQVVCTMCTQTLFECEFIPI